jgi:hypothetical protein
MRHFINILLFQFIVFSLCSCTSSKKLIGKSQTEYGRIKFYAVNAGGDKNFISKVYADVESSGVKRYYSFYPKGIMMTDERAKNLSYTVLFQQLPAKYDSNAYRSLSPLDTFVFSKSKTLMKSPKYSYLRSPEGATGYEIEVYNLHGFPKNRKFQPL